MHRILALLWLCPAIWCANPPVISNLSITSITRTGVRVSWTTDTSSTTKLEWGTTVSYGSTRDIHYQSWTTHSIFLSGLAGGTLYHVRACSTDSSEACSADQTFTTLPEITTVTELPIPPAPVDVSVPTLTGTSFMASSCADIQTRINAAAALDGDLNHEVVIPANFVCEGPWSLPARSGTNPNGSGWIHVRSASTNIPPEGMRAIMADTGEMPTVIANRVQARILPSQPGDCFYRGDLWWDSDANEPALYQCTNQSPVTYTPVSFVGSGTTLPGTCTEGSWYYKTDVSGHNNRAHWCVSENTWRRVTFIGGGVFTEWSAVVPNASAKRYRFTGIRIQALPMPPSWVASLHQTDRTLGSLGGCLAHTNSTNDRIIFDRMIFDGVGYPNRTINALCLFDGSNVAVVNSFFNEINRPVPSNSTNETPQSGIIFQNGPGPVRIENNYFKNNIGLTVFAVDGSGSGGSLSPKDVTLRRNYFYEDPLYNYFDPNSNGQRHWRRNILELKRGERWLIEGNVFDGGWPTSTTGACLSLTPRPGNAANLTTTIGLRDIAIRDNWFKNCPEAIAVVGWNDYFFGQLTHGIRFLVENNLMTSLGLTSTGIAYGWPYNTKTTGRTSIVQLGVQDLTMRHNTIYGSYGSAHRPDLVFAYQDQFSSSGLKLTDNIFYATGPGAHDPGVSSASLRGTAALNLMWVKGTAAAWQMAGNVIVKNPGNHIGDYPSGTYWPLTASAIGLDSSYRLLPSSTYKGAAYYGGDPGVEWWRYDGARGIMSRLRGAGTGANSIMVAYQAPDGGACTAAAGGVRIFDGGGGRDRLVTITGLTAATDYTVTVYCGAERKTLNLTTAAAPGASINLMVRLSAPPNRGVADAVIDYGATSALGSSTTAVTCSSNCSIAVPAVRNVPVHLRVRWRNGAGQTIGHGRIESRMP